MTGKIKRKKSLFKRLHENKKFLAAESIFLPVLLGLVIYLLWQFQILHKILNTTHLFFHSRVELVILSQGTGAGL